MIWLQMFKAFRLNALSKQCNSSYGSRERYLHSKPVKLKTASCLGPIHTVRHVSVPSRNVTVQ